MIKKIYYTAAILVALSVSAMGQLIEYEDISIDPDQTFRLEYKKIDSVVLDLVFYYPDDFDASSEYPAIIFFHGGGWNQGSPGHFRHHAQYLESRGMVCVLVEYRIKQQHGTTPFEAVRDAKSAIRFVRKNADKLHVIPDSIAAGGGSAGGHLAAVAGNVYGLEEPGEDHSISSKPNALVLFNPVIDTSPEGFGYRRVKDRYREISPIHNIREGAPPTIAFFGTEDKVTSPDLARKYKRKMEGAGSRCDLHLYEGQEHGFFNYGNTEYYIKTMIQTHKFLASLGYLHGKPAIQAFESR